MDKREIIAAKLAEWDLVLSEAEIEQLVPAYEKLQVWRQVMEDMLHSRPMSEGMSFPQSEPLLTHAIAQIAGRRNPRQ